MLRTARNHFTEDIARARALVSHAEPLPEGLIKKDVLRAAWMMAVGAADAYFCDAYADLVSRTLRAKERERHVPLSKKINHLLIPAGTVLSDQYSNGWRWRMFGRGIVEKDNVLSIEKIKDLFNPFFRKDHRLFSGKKTLEKWILLQHSMHRIFGLYRADYKAGDEKTQQTLRTKAQEHLNKRFDSIFQRRHDCIHNCDRPKITINSKQIEPIYVKKVIIDIEYIVTRCHDAFLEEFPIYLKNCGFSAPNRTQVML